jgi:hypothetical protein
MKIIAEKDFQKAHPLIQMSRTVLEATTPDHYGRVGPGWKDKCVNIVTTKMHLRRALLLLDAILRGLEAKGHKAEVVQNQNRFETRIKIGAEFVRIRITERTTQKENKEKSISSFRYVYEPTGVFTFQTDESRIWKSWSDSISGKLETLTGEIVEGIVLAGEELRLGRIESEEEDRRSAEKRRKKMELERLWEQEKDRRQKLERHAEIWDKVARLRVFIDACESRLADNEDLIVGSPAVRWLEWARRHADKIDPLKSDYLPDGIQSLPENPVEIEADDD